MTQTVFAQCPYFFKRFLNTRRIYTRVEIIRAIFVVVIAQVNYCIHVILIRYITGGVEITALVIGAGNNCKAQVSNVTGWHSARSAYDRVSAIVLKAIIIPGVFLQARYIYLNGIVLAGIGGHCSRIYDGAESGVSRYLPVYRFCIICLAINAP